MKKRIFIAIVLALLIIWSVPKISSYFPGQQDLPEPIAYEKIKEEVNVDSTSSTPAELPTATSTKPIVDPVINTTTPSTPVITVTKEQINLAVPFQAQAPFGNWVEPYKEACEEASLIMVDHYLAGTSLSKQQMQDEIDAQISWELKNWGGHFDLTLAQTAELAQAMYNYQTRIISDLTIDKIKAELNAGNPVIVPAAGRELDNPNFKQPGPLYHMLVIKGYLPGKFITNDPGTRNGADYVYTEKVLLAAIRDWTGSAPDGPKVGLVLEK